jgi:hypothetical protein
VIGGNIGLDFPKTVIDQRDHGIAHVEIGPDHNMALGHHAVIGGTDKGVVEVDLGQFQIGPGALKAGLGFGFFAFKADHILAFVIVTRL